MNVAADMTVGIRFSVSMVRFTTFLDTLKGALVTCCMDGSQHMHTSYNNEAALTNST